jgi:hypothetical protein
MQQKRDSESSRLPRRGERAQNKSGACPGGCVCSYKNTSHNVLIMRSEPCVLCPFSPCLGLVCPWFLLRISFTGHMRPNQLRSDRQNRGGRVVGHCARKISSSPENSFLGVMIYD